MVVMEVVVGAWGICGGLVAWWLGAWMGGGCWVLGWLALAECCPRPPVPGGGNCDSNWIERLHRVCTHPVFTRAILFSV